MLNVDLRQFKLRRDEYRAQRKEDKNDDEPHCNTFCFRPNFWFDFWAAEKNQRSDDSDSRGEHHNDTEGVEATQHAKPIKYILHITPKVL